MQTNPFIRKKRMEILTSKSRLTMGGFLIR